MPRLLVRDATQDGDRVRLLDARQSHHVVRVLRLGAGARLECFDGAGVRFEATIEQADPRACRVRIGAALPSTSESALQLQLWQCVSSAERMDWTIEKAVELGVQAIHPLVSARSPVRLDAERMRRRHEHWSRIVEAACMQCGRDRLPELHDTVAFERGLAGLAALHEDDRPTPIVLAPSAGLRLSRVPIDAQRPIALLVGPESGLADAELAQARVAGFIEARIGARTLRTETAGVAALAALQALAGDF